VINGLKYEISLQTGVRQEMRMSTETIVNRTPGPATDLQVLEAKNAKDLIRPAVDGGVSGSGAHLAEARPLPVVTEMKPLPIPKEFNYTEFQTAEGQRAGQVGSVTPSNQELDEEQLKLVDQAASELANSLPVLNLVERFVRTHAPRDPDLKKFKEEVIAAFKHLGLDTRKFFGQD
jgi:hypothetical protein